MESEAKIRRMFFIQKLSIADIVRKTQVSRNTVRRVIRADKVGKMYQRSVQPVPMLGNFKETLVEWLSVDDKLPKKERRSAMKYFTQLQSKGYVGAYDSIQRFVKSWKLENKGSCKGYIPQYFSPGEAYQFDWSEEVVEIGKVVQKIKVAQFRLSYSRKFFLVAYTRETQEMLFDAHNLAFTFFEGLTLRGIYDNMKTAVDSIFSGKQRVFNRRFLSLMDHYLIEPTACTPRAGWEKGQIENQVDNVRDWLFKPRLKYSTLAELNDYLRQQCQELANKRKHPEQKELTIDEVFQEEKNYLRPLNQPFDGYREIVCQVYSTSLVQFDRNRYSVDCAYVNKMVILKAYATTVEIFYEQENIGSHERTFGRNKTFFNPWHYLPLLERKPGALRNGAPFKDWALPDAIVKVKGLLLKRIGGDRECVMILVAMSEYGVEAVNTACALAIEEKVMSGHYIINILNRLNSSGSPEPIETPTALRLHQEPQANCHQYNALLSEVNYVLH